MLAMIAHVLQTSCVILLSTTRSFRAWRIDPRWSMIGRIKTQAREELRYVHLILHLNARTGLGSMTTGPFSRCRSARFHHQQNDADLEQRHHQQTQPIPAIMPYPPIIIGSSSERSSACVRVISFDGMILQPQPSYDVWNHQDLVKLWRPHPRLSSSRRKKAASGSSRWHKRKQDWHILVHNVSRPHL
jgi:hypothetical protein